MLILLDIGRKKSYTIKCIIMFSEVFMFGYVNVCLSSITEEDKKLYSSYYCGLCKAIAKKSQLMRLGLNNDLTFLSVLLSGVYQKEPEFLRNSRCIMHSFKKHDEVIMNEVMDYTSDMNILLVYLKICDDAVDDKSISKKGISSLFRNTAEQIMKKYPKTSKIIADELKRLSVLESNKCEAVDEVSDCFAKLLEAIFVPDFITDENTRKILSWIGYNLGRWIYILDAYEDLEKDRSKNRYNPLIYYKSEDLKNDIYNSMTYTLANIANAYDLLDIERNDTLIRNILYAGLLMKQESIFNKTEESNGSL